jgi:hypothetical protein
MAIITYAAPPSKGQPTIVTLNKADLLLNSVVAADDYFSNSSNWKAVTVTLQLSGGKQKVKMRFNAQEATPTSRIFLSEKAQDGDFEVTDIRIVDFDRGSLYVGRGSLNASEFDLEINEEVPALTGDTFTRTFNTEQLSWEDLESDNSSNSSSSDAMIEINELDKILKYEMPEIFNYSNYNLQYRATLGSPRIVLKANTRYRVELFYTNSYHGSNSQSPNFSIKVGSASLVDYNFRDTFPPYQNYEEVPEVFTTEITTLGTVGNIFELNVYAVDQDDTGAGGDGIQFTQYRITELLD